jgi:cytochrome c
MQTTLKSMIAGTAIAVLALAILPAVPGPVSAQQGGMMGEGQGGMMQQEMADLSSLSPDRQVVSLRYCESVYHVTTAEGDALEFAEFNLRFKTDGSEMGPPQGTPALLPASMMGDRGFVIFAAPQEVSAFIENEC